MSKVLKIDEMLEVLDDIDHPLASDFIGKVEALGNEIAETIAQALDVSFGPATFEGSDFGGTCATFKPKYKGQLCPDAIDTQDMGGEWEEEDNIWRCDNCGETAQDGSGICITCGMGGSE
ncbi:hypothetical protein ABE527_14210 [Brucella sp. TWI432]